MNIEFTREGNLIIAPNEEIDIYALKDFLDNYYKGKSIIVICQEYNNEIKTEIKHNTKG